VPVRENFFFVDLETAAVEGPHSVTWRYGGEERSLDVGRLVEHSVPLLGVDEGEPVPDTEALAQSASAPLSFTVAGTRYTAVGFHTSRSMICTSLVVVDSGTPHGQSCLSERLLPEALEERPAHLFAGGSVGTGYARGDVVEITPGDAAGGATVVLSEPWSPEPWAGEPIRFFFVFRIEEPGPGEPRPPTPLTVRLSDGQTVRVP
jgi:hypothetical protein